MLWHRQEKVFGKAEIPLTEQLDLRSLGQSLALHPNSSSIIQLWIQLWTIKVTLDSASWDSLDLFVFIFVNELSLVCLPLTSFTSLSLSLTEQLGRWIHALIFLFIKRCLFTILKSEITHNGPSGRTWQKKLLLNNLLIRVIAQYMYHKLWYIYNRKRKL